MKALIHRYAPRAMVNFAWNLASDLKDLPHRLRDPRPRPWRIVHNSGGGDFFRIGDAFFERFKSVLQLQPDAHVLDLGCGAGRMARPICAYLNAQGAYTGFDISRSAIGFAKRIVRRRAAVSFHHADLSNGEYRLVGAPASHYRFPVADHSIDAALATSLFSHLMPEVAQAYLAETARVLKPNGQLLMTGFLVDAAARAAFVDESARLPMEPLDEDSFAADLRHPERAIGFAEDAVLRWADEVGLDLVGDIHRGNWRAQSSRAADFQDWLVLKRRAD